MAAKFSPLIQTRSTLPPSSRPACFSASTRETASATSETLTCSTATPKRSSTSSPAQSM